MFHQIGTTLQEDDSTPAQELKARSLAGMVRALLAKGGEEAKAADAVVDVLKTTYGNFLTVPDVARAIAAASLTGAPAGDDLSELRTAAEAAPADADALFKYAEAASSGGTPTVAIDALLQHIKAHGVGWNDGAAKELLLKVFEAQGPTHPDVVDGRKRLAKLLFV